MTDELVRDTIAAIGELDEELLRAARARQGVLTKPPGSLGRLEELSVQLAGIRGVARPRFAGKAVVVFAADHGVVAEGVSAYPAEVTGQMVANFLAGGAAINVLARAAGARVLVVDVGVNGDLASHPDLVRRNVARGTRNLAREAAMTRDEALAAIAVGIEVVAELVAGGTDLLAIGEMGIGNTTAASAIISVFIGTPAARVTGRGTGIDDATLARKIAAIERAQALHHPDPAAPLDALAKVGGLEIAALAGAILGASARRVPVIVDGLIAGAGALVAAALAPRCRSFLIAGHRSVEPGHDLALDHLGLRPLLDLGLRLGEGTGAVLAMPIVEAAARLLDEMATFGEAGVSGATAHGG